MGVREENGASKTEASRAEEIRELGFAGGLPCDMCFPFFRGTEVLVSTKRI
jgi:hypothetical protein